MNGASRKPVWEVVYQRPGPGGAFDKAAARPPQRMDFGNQAHFYRPRLLPPQDLDGDGIRDLVWVGHWPAGTAPSRATRAASPSADD